VSIERATRPAPAGLVGAAAFAAVSVALVAIGPGSSGARPARPPLAADAGGRDTLEDSLGLDPAQRAAWNSLRADHCAARAALTAEGSVLRRRIHGEEGALAAAPPITEVEAHRERVLALRRALDARLDALLTAEQRVVFRRSRDAFVWAACP
jgi:hypothetical protein